MSVPSLISTPEILAAASLLHKQKPSPACDNISRRPPLISLTKLLDDSSTLPHALPETHIGDSGWLTSTSGRVAQHALNIKSNATAEGSRPFSSSLPRREDVFSLANRSFKPRPANRRSTPTPPSATAQNRADNEPFLSELFNYIDFALTAGTSENVIDIHSDVTSKCRKHFRSKKKPVEAVSVPQTNAARASSKSRFTAQFLAFCDTLIPPQHPSLSSAPPLAADLNNINLAYSSRFYEKINSVRNACEAYELLSPYGPSKDEIDGNVAESDNIGRNSAVSDGQHRLSPEVTSDDIAVEPLKFSDDAENSLETPYELSLAIERFRKDTAQVLLSIKQLTKNSANSSTYYDVIMDNLAERQKQHIWSTLESPKNYKLSTMDKRLNAFMRAEAGSVTLFPQLNLTDIYNALHFGDAAGAEEKDEIKFNIVHYDDAEQENSLDSADSFPNKRTAVEIDASNKRSKSEHQNKTVNGQELTGTSSLSRIYENELALSSRHQLLYDIKAKAID